MICAILAAKLMLFNKFQAVPLDVRMLDEASSHAPARSATT